MSTGNTTGPAPDAKLHPGLKGGIVAAIVAVVLSVWPYVKPFLPENVSTTIQPIIVAVEQNKDKIATLDATIDDVKGALSQVKDLIDALHSKADENTQAIEDVKAITEIKAETGPTPISSKTEIDELKEQIKNLSDVVRKLLDPPVPKPIEETKVVPKPGSATIVVTDTAGNPVTDSATESKPGEVEDGHPVKILATVPVKWRVDKSNPDDVFLLEFPTGFSCTLRNGASATFFAAGTSIDPAMIKVQAKKAPQPPPKPDPIEPTVDTKPKPPKPANDMRVLFIYESKQNHSRSQDLILSSALTGKIFDKLQANCSKGADGRPNWRRWDQDNEIGEVSPMGKMFRECLPGAKEKGLPVVVVACGDVSTIYPIGLDATEESVLAVLNCGGAK